MTIARSTVRAWVEEVVFPTYLPAVPDKNPMFLEKRVYQGSSGKVYPLPFTDRIAEKPVDRKWKAVWIENKFLRVMILPEIGGRIHRIQDKTNGYDLIYYQPVIKPALVGLAGPWISGGIEFNWPQHHRPATFLPVDFHIEDRADGSKIVWCSDHDPLCRMKGMHGVCLHPGRAYVELKVRAYNRTPFVQTFLWWANVATRVHEGYQSFFPPDVHYVADHAHRSMSEYPRAQGTYYGVDYGERGRRGIPTEEVPKQFVPPHHRSKLDVRCSMFDVSNYSPNDLSCYANIPVPTSYMCMGSQEDFFGGYDHFAQAGIVHIANHHIAPGKKQWTWGNHEFGYAWDRNLTDPDEKGEYAPYIEIMSGVFTDNQPDFSFLQPGETKSWSQYWYPIQKIGPAQHANLEGAVSLQLEKQLIRIGVSVTRSFPRAIIRLERKTASWEWDRNLQPCRPFIVELQQTRRPWKVGESVLRVLDRDGREIISYQPKPRTKTQVPPPATEPLAPRDVASADELFITGQHLDQYRHATRCPTLYWREALRRDAGDARCNNAIGLWRLMRGEFSVAEMHFRKAIARLTQRNANPYDGEPFYNLGLCLRYQLDAGPRRWSEAQPQHIENNTSAEPDHSAAAGAAHTAAVRLFEDAYDAFYKATWSQAWAAASYHALAEMDCRRADWVTALEHLNHSLRFNTDNTRARILKVIVLRKLAEVGQASSLSMSSKMPDPLSAADALLRETLALDPLDWWTRYLNGDELDCDSQIALDLIHDYCRAGLLAEALEVLGAQTKRCMKDGTAQIDEDLPNQSWGASPILSYTATWLHDQLGNDKAARNICLNAGTSPPDYCFPSRLEEIAILETAMRAYPNDSVAPYLLGNLLYDRRRHEEAIRLWKRSAKLNPNYCVVRRNLGIGYFNILKQPARARASYDRAFELNPGDARLLFERDQLWKRLRESPKKRLRELEQHLDLVQRRDDLSIELCALFNQTGQPAKALAFVSLRKFQPWEGGEGGPLGQWVRSNLALGRAALEANDAAKARGHFEAALTAPQNLGEARHLLANQSDVHFWLGCAQSELGERKKAREHWRRAATFKGDFQSMSVRAFSEMTYYSALSWQRLCQRVKAKKLFRELLAYAQKLQHAEAKIDYFATSLPTMLLFDDDLQFRQETTALFLQAQAQLGLGNVKRGRALLRTVLNRDPNYALAADLAAGI